MKWAGENSYNAEIAAAITSTGNVVSSPLVKAIIGVESGFKPSAYRAEVAIGDASRGLMQILLRTAQGVGFRGAAADLFNPTTNILYGVKYFSGLVRARGGDVAAAVSAYNNGHGRRATAPATVCLARDGTGKCITTFTAQPGQFLNQPYVDKVMAVLRYFDPQVPAAPAGSLFTLVILGGALYLATRLSSKGPT